MTTSDWPNTAPATTPYTRRPHGYPLWQTLFLAMQEFPHGLPTLQTGEWATVGHLAKRPKPSRQGVPTA